ncbi:hypothetical protein M8J76_013497 [Diaphorina citri]|nr:hypothetical protein M8J76_013497 [Diaphorina citri]
MSSNYPEHLNPFATDYDEKFHLKQRLVLSFPSPPPRVRRSNSLRSTPQTPLASPACDRRTVSKFGKTRPAPSPPVKRAPNPPATALTAPKITAEPTQNRTQSPSEITSTQTSSKDATQTPLTSLKNINQTSSKITQSSTDETTPPSQNGTTRSSLKITSTQPSLKDATQTSPKISQLSANESIPPSQNGTTQSSLKITSTQPSLKDATRTSPKISQLSANESIPPSQNGTIQSSSKITSQPCLKDETSSKITQLPADETIPPFQNGTAHPSQNGTTQNPQRDTTPSVSPYTAHHSQFKTSQPSTKATPTFVSNDAMESGEISGPFPNSSFSSSQSSPNISASSSVSLASCIATPSALPSDSWSLSTAMSTYSTPVSHLSTTSLGDTLDSGNPEAVAESQGRDAKPGVQSSSQEVLPSAKPPIANSETGTPNEEFVEIPKSLPTSLRKTLEDKGNLEAAEEGQGRDAKPGVVQSSGQEVLPSAKSLIANSERTGTPNELVEISKSLPIVHSSNTITEITKITPTCSKIIQPSTHETTEPTRNGTIRTLQSRKALHRNCEEDVTNTYTASSAETATKGFLPDENGTIESEVSDGNSLRISRESSLKISQITSAVRTGTIEAILTLYKEYKNTLKASKSNEHNKRGSSDERSPKSNEPTKPAPSDDSSLKEALQSPENSQAMSAKSKTIEAIFTLYEGCKNVQSSPKFSRIPKRRTLPENKCKTDGRTQPPDQVANAESDFVEVIGAFISNTVEEIHPKDPRNTDQEGCENFMDADENKESKSKDQTNTITDQGEEEEEEENCEDEDEKLEGNSKQMSEGRYQNTVEEINPTHVNTEEESRENVMDVDDKPEARLKQMSERKYQNTVGDTNPRDGPLVTNTLAGVKPKDPTNTNTEQEDSKNVDVDETKSSANANYSNQISEQRYRNTVEETNTRDGAIITNTVEDIHPKDPTNTDQKDSKKVDVDETKPSANSKQTSEDLDSVDDNLDSSLQREKYA